MPSPVAAEMGTTSLKSMFFLGTMSSGSRWKNSAVWNTEDNPVKRCSEIDRARTQLEGGRVGGRWSLC